MPTGVLNSNDSLMKDAPVRAVHKKEADCGKLLMLSKNQGIRVD